MPDSAGTCTAYLCGEKARAGVIGVSQRVVRGDCSTVEGNELKSILKHAQDAGTVQHWGTVQYTGTVQYSGTAQYTGMRSELVNAW